MSDWLKSKDLELKMEFLLSIGVIHIMVLNSINPDYDPNDPFETSFINQFEDINRIGLVDDKVIIMCFPKGVFSYVERYYMINYFKNKE